MKIYVFVIGVALGCLLVSAEDAPSKPETGDPKLPLVEPKTGKVSRRSAEMVEITDKSGKTHKVMVVEEMRPDGSRVKRGVCNTCGGGGYGGGGHGGRGYGGGGCSTCGGGGGGGFSGSYSKSSSSSSSGSYGGGYGK